MNEPILIEGLRKDDYIIRSQSPEGCFCTTRPGLNTLNLLMWKSMRPGGKASILKTVHTELNHKKY